MPPLHDWNLSEADTVEVQRRLALLVDTGTPLGPITTLAGCDIAYDTTSDVAWAAVVVMTFPDLIEIERVVVREEVTFPYVPGLLSFRECPPLLSALSRLRKLPDVVILDAQGIAHPRKFGSACHLGLWLGVPTVGCAKTWLCGEHPEVGPMAGDHAPLTMEGEPVGAVVRSATNVRTVYVFAGTPGGHHQFGTVGDGHPEWVSPPDPDPDGTHGGERGTSRRGRKSRKW